MDDATVARREATAAWELRGAWASRRTVVLTLDATLAMLSRVAGYVERVSPTGAVAEIEDLDGDRISVPLRVVLVVRRPHFHEPGDREALAAPARPARDDGPLDGQLSWDL